jgi:hypothetical protein
VEKGWKKALAYETLHAPRIGALRFDLHAISRDFTPETVRKGH